MNAKTHGGKVTQKANTKQPMEQLFLKIIILTALDGGQSSWHTRNIIQTQWRKYH